MPSNNSAFNHFKSLLSAKQRSRLDSFKNPTDIQAYLDTLVYSPEDRNRSPLNVMQDGTAHCLDGALMAAVAMRWLGYQPRILDMLPALNTDDDHIIVIFQRGGYYGAIAKSNFVYLRSRQPVYRSLRELVLTYFDGYFNVNGIHTLRSYTRPHNLAAMDFAGWMWSDAGGDAVERRLTQLRRIPLVTEEMAAAFTPVDPITYKAGMLIVNEAGLYRPGQHGGHA